MKPWLSMLAAAAFGVFGASSQSAATELDPTVYRSPSGHYELGVDPNERTGAGAARYELRLDGQPVWSGERPFAFADARVTDEGIAGGYAYGGGNESDAGDFIVAILDARGHTRLVQRTPRVMSRYLHVDGDPKARGLLVADGRLIVRVDDPDVNTASESWWAYRLRDGRVLPKVQPRTRQNDAKALGSLVAARAVAGTPLILAQWIRRDQGACGECRYGARFALVDASARPVWTLDLPGDYELPDSHAASRLVVDISQEGAILDTSQERRFDVRQVASNERVGFVVERDGRRNGWKVVPAARAQFVHPPVSAPPADANAPRELGTIVLQAPSVGGRSDVHDVYDFAIGDSGRSAFLDQDPDDDAAPMALVVVDADGKLERRIDLPAGARRFGAHLAWIDGNRWLVTCSPSADEVHSRAWRVDATDGRLTALEHFDAPEIEAIAITRSGGFAALVHGEMGEELRAYDASGRQRWTVAASSSRDDGIFSAEDVAIAPSGEVVVLENVSDTIKVFSADGRFVRVIALKQAWGREPQYPTGVTIDAHGDAIVRDGATLVRMTLHGKVMANLDPIYPDRRRFDMRRIQVGPDGRLWTSDGDALLRLDDEGVVDRVVGQAPAPDMLGNVASMLVTPQGEIYAVDKRTGAVHRYDAHGRRVRVYRPNADDQVSRMAEVRVNLPGDGSVYVDQRDGGRSASLRFAEDGRRIGVLTSIDDDVAADWIALPGTSRRWLIGYRDIALAEEDGTIIRRIDRDARRRWLLPGPAAASPDGRLAVLSNGAFRQMATLRQRKGFGTVAIYSAQGDAIDAWAAPPETGDYDLGYDGERLAFLAGLRSPGPTRIVVTDARGRELSRFKPRTPPRSVHFVQGDGGRELWVFDGKASIVRYAVP